MQQMRGFVWWPLLIIVLVVVGVGTYLVVHNKERGNGTETFDWIAKNNNLGQGVASSSTTVGTNNQEENVAISNSSEAQSSLPQAAGVKSTQTSSPSLKKYRSETLGIGFEVPKHVAVNEVSLGKYGTFSFFIGKNLSGEGIKTRVDVAQLTVNDKLPSFSGYENYGVKIKVTSVKIGGVPAKQYSVVYNGEEAVQSIVFTRNENSYILSPLRSNFVTKEEQELYKHVVNTFYFFEPTRNEFPNVTFADLEVEAVRDGNVRQMLQSVAGAVYNQMYMVGYGIGDYGVPARSCNTDGSIFDTPEVVTRIEKLEEEGVTDLACYAEGALYAISVRRPVASKGGNYWCHDNSKENGEWCSVTSQITGPKCGECLNSCYLGFEGIAC